MWDAAKAVAEARRMHKRGVKGITFAFPQQFGYPHLADPYWDPLWDAAQELDLPVNFHFWYEVVGARLRDYIGIENIMWESDYPHPTGTWPDSRKYIEASMQGWTDEERRKVLMENAVRVFNLAA